MLRKTLLAAAMAGTMALGLTATTSPAEAKHRHHNGGVGLYFGFPFFGPGYYDDGYYYGDGYRYRHHRGNYHCHWVKVKKKHHKARWVKRCHRRLHHW